MSYQFWWHWSVLFVCRKRKTKANWRSQDKEKPLPPIAGDEIPFDIPNSWMWCQLGDVTTYSQTKVKINGKDICSNIWSLDLEDIEKDTGKILNKVQSSERKIKGDKTKFFKGDITL